MRQIYTLIPIFILFFVGSSRAKEMAVKTDWDGLDKVAILNSLPMSQSPSLAIVIVKISGASMSILSSVAVPHEAISSSFNVSFKAGDCNVAVRRDSAVAGEMDPWLNIVLSSPVATNEPHGIKLRLTDGDKEFIYWTSSAKSQLDGAVYRVIAFSYRAG